MFTSGQTSAGVPVTIAAWTADLSTIDSSFAVSKTVSR
jgi:hypothetical protein